MKNLLERLKPEYKAALELEAAEFPNTVQHLRETLAGNYTLMNLTYGDVVVLTATISSVTNVYLPQPWDFFEEL